MRFTPETALKSSIVGRSFHARTGTPAYWAPEIINACSEQPYEGCPVDMWSAGVMLYVLLTSCYPFNPDCDEARLEAAIKACECIPPQPPPPPSTLPPYSPFHHPPHELPPRLLLNNLPPFPPGRYDRSRLNSVSDAARDLVFHLLELDPTRRLTAAQALQHAFIAQLDHAPHAKAPAIRASVLEKLRRTVTVIRGYQVRGGAGCDVWREGSRDTELCSVCCAASGGRTA